MRELVDPMTGESLLIGFEIGAPAAWGELPVMPWRQGRIRLKIERLSWFLRRRGGIRETLTMRGELRARDITNQRLPGLICNRGMSLDDATLAAWEAGFLYGPDRPPPDELLYALELDLAGKRIVREIDQAEADLEDEAASSLEAEEAAWAAAWARPIEEIEALAGPITELTPEGEQLVIPGAEQRTREALERRMAARDIRGGQKGLEGLSLFDPGSRETTGDLFSRDQSCHPGRTKPGS